MPYLTADALFTQPAIWLQWETSEWIHRGHVTEHTATQALTQPDDSDLDPMETIPGTIRHQWMRFAHHDPAAECDDDYCDCPRSDDDSYLWWEATSRSADGAIPVTRLTARSIEADALA